MFCPNCGKQIPDNANFCEFCGARLNNNNNLANNENDIYNHSYYKNNYKKQPNTKKKQEFSFGESFLKGVLTMILILLGLLGLVFAKSYFSDNLFSLDKMRYQQYIEDPSMIPELTEPETLSGLVDNLKEVQSFLVLYMNFSDDDMDTKMETFDKYRKEILKIQKFSNSNLLQENVKYQIPQNEKEFKKIQKQYAKILAPVGLMVVADDGYAKYHLQEDNRFTAKKFGKLVPTDVAEYLKLRAKYYQTVMNKDSLSVKPYQLAQRIGDYEKFMNSHKEFRYSDEVNDLLFSYTFIYAFTSDRTDMVYINKKTFVKSDKKFIKKYPSSQLKTMFGHLASSANGISESQFDEMYPYEYQKGLDAIKPDSSELSDIFSTVRKGIMSLKSDDSYEYIYSAESDSWFKYDATRQLKKGDIILARTDSGYDIYDYKYKKTNQTITTGEPVKFIIKSGKLLAYLPNHLQLSSVESMYGSFSLKPLSIRSIKKFFPNVLIINMATFGDTSVQIDKPSGAKTYMLISTSGMSYDGYRLSGNIEMGELGNIFTVTSDSETQVNFTPSGDGDNYHIYFTTQGVQPQADASVEQPATAE